LKETRPLWLPQRGVGLREPNLGKTNPRVSLVHSLAICFCALSRGLVSFLLTLTRLVVVFIFVNFSFALFTPPPSRRLSLSLSLSPTRTLVTPYCKRIQPPWAQDNTKAVVSPYCSLPFVSRLAPTHLG
jgi:flagellar biosynthesis protein FliP